MPHELGTTNVYSARLEYLVIEAMYEGEMQEIDRDRCFARGIMDFLCSQTDAQVVQLAADVGIIASEDREDHLYIGLAPEV